MKVLHVIKVAGIGGAEIFLSKLLPDLNRVGVESTLLAMINLDHPEEAKVFIDLMQAAQVKVIQVDVTHNFSFKMYRQISKIISEGNYDLVNTHLVHSDIYLYMVKKFFNKKLLLVNTFHGYNVPHQLKYRFEPVFDPKDKFFWIYKFIGKAFNRSIVNSYGLRNLLVGLKLIPENKIDVVHFGFDYSGISYDSDISKYRKSKKQIVIVGRLDIVKGHTFAFQAMPQIIKHFPEIKLVIVGSGNQEENLKNEVNERGISDYVVFEGFQSRIHDYLKNSDVVLIPSYAEGFCLVVLESYYNKKPVICFDVPALNEIVDNGKTGITIPKFDIEKLSLGIIQLLEDSALVERLTKTAYKKLNTYFTQERMMKQTIDVYEHTLKEAKVK